MEIPEKFIEKIRTYSNDEFRKFIERVKSDVMVKALANGSLSDPDAIRLMQCALVIQVLLERVESR